MALNGQKSKKIDPKKELIPSKKPKNPSNRYLFCESLIKE